MKRKKSKYEKDRVGHYFRLLHQYGEEDASVLFPEVYRRLQLRARRAAHEENHETAQ